MAVAVAVGVDLVGPFLLIEEGEGEGHLPLGQKGHLVVVHRPEEEG